MSSAVARKATAALRDVKSQEANALDVVPDAYLAETVRLWTRNHFFIQNPLALATRLRDWIDEEGLTAEEWSAVVRKASRPERQAAIDTCPKFMADLAALVADAVKYRERQSASRRAIDGVRSEPIDPAVREALKRSGLLGEGRAG